MKRALPSHLLHCWTKLRWNTRIILLIGFLAFVIGQSWIFYKYHRSPSSELQFLPRPYAPSACGETFKPLDRPLASVPHPATGRPRTLVVYNYYASEDSSANFRFFLEHALHERTDTQFFLVLSAATCKRIPYLSNLAIWTAPSSVYGFAAIKLALESLELTDRFDKFILLGSWVRGPFMPSWSHQCWTDAFTRLLHGNMHFSGTTYSCSDGEGFQMPHLHPTAWAVTKSALPALLAPFGPNSCSSPNSRRLQSMNVNMVRKAGYNVSTLSPGWPSNPELGCKQDWEFKPHPYETIFVNTRLSSYIKYDPKDEKDSTAIDFVKQATTSMDLRKYDSRKYCR